MTAAENNSGVKLFPSIPYADWMDTKNALHRFAQIVGKARCAVSMVFEHQHGRG